MTEHTALAVMPQRPPGPLLVMMFTAAGSWAMALRKSIWVWLRSAISAPLSLVGPRKRSVVDGSRVSVGASRMYSDEPYAGRRSPLVI
ncbi:hypothetical protein D3C76_1400070 [compost metagenome]